MQVAESANLANVEIRHKVRNTQMKLMKETWLYLEDNGLLEHGFQAI